VPERARPDGANQGQQDGIAPGEMALRFAEQKLIHKSASATYRLRLSVRAAPCKR
jgi:hypothetical protein